MNAFFFLTSILLYFNEIYRNFSEQNPFPTLFPKNFELSGSEKRTETKNLKRTKKNEAKNGSGFFARALEKKAKLCFEAKIFQSETGASKFTNSYPDPIPSFTKVIKSVFVFTVSQYCQFIPVVLFFSSAS